MKSIVAIVGRPNVGKSSLFNRIVGWRKAIVNDAPGVTRDRHYSVADWCGREFIVVDTGGIDFAPEIDLESKVTKQSLEAISEADIVLCVFDGQVEPTSHDIELTRKLNKIGKPVIYAINKIDEAVHEGRKDCYYELGMDDFVMCSSEHGRNFDELLDKIIGYLPDEKEENKNKEALYVTVVGRPNVGKSTLINRLAGNERVIAHEMPGTTRDSIDVDIEFEGAHYVFVDTAGIRKSFKVHERVEKISAMKALRTVDRSEIICFLIDATDKITHQDLNLISFIHSEGKGITIFVNKWDLIDSSWDEFEQDIKDRLGELSYLTILPISAKTGYNCLKIFSWIQNINNNLNSKITTSKLNKIVQDALMGHHLPVCKGRQINIYYCTQIGTRPPTFALFANYPADIPEAYRRYLKNKLAEKGEIHGVPIKLVFRKKK